MLHGIMLYWGMMFQRRLPSGLVNDIVSVHGVPTWISHIAAAELGTERFVLVIPGNPGPIGFYQRFIESLFKASNSSLSIYGISHAGHHFIPCECNMNEKHSSFGVTCSDFYFYESKVYSLYDQIDHKLAFVYEFLPPDSELVLIGHSIGAFIILEIMRRLQNTKRVVKGVLLFPTIERITKTSSGKFWTTVAYRMQKPLLCIVWLFCILPFTIQRALVSLFVGLRRYSSGENIPFAILSFLNEDGVTNMLQVACDMKGIEDLPHEFVIEENEEKIVLYYGEHDPWVPVSFCEKKIERFPSAIIKQCNDNHKHAFVLHSAAKFGRLVWNLISDVFR